MMLPGYVEEDFLVKGIREITDSLLAVNSAFNFLLYCSMSQAFRSTFLLIFCPFRHTSPERIPLSRRSTKSKDPDTPDRSANGHQRCANGNTRETYL